MLHREQSAFQQLLCTVGSLLLPRDRKMGDQVVYCFIASLARSIREREGRGKMDEDEKGGGVAEPQEP